MCQTQEQFQLSFVDKFVVFAREIALFITFSNLSHSPYVDAECTLQLEITNQHRSGEVWLKFKESDLLNFCRSKYLRNDTYGNLRSAEAVCASLFGST
jgi:hypothetical protein